MDTAAKVVAEELWRERILAQRSAGGSIRGWCKANGFHEYAFYFWRSRLGLSPGPLVKRRRSVRQAGFAEVVVDSSAIPPALSNGMAHAGERMSLRLPSGVELTLPMMPVEKIAGLIRAIEVSA